MAASVALYATPDSPLGRPLVVIDSGAAAMITVKDCELVPPAESFTCRVNVEDPAAAGVPETAPVLLFNASPPGSVPAVIVHVYGAVPPLAPTVVLYAVPAAPLGSDVVVIATGAATAIETGAFTCCPETSLT